MNGFLGKRDGWWHYVRRVPAVYAQHDTRGIVRQSTKIRIADDPRGIAAAKAAAKINAETETYWRGLFLGRPDEAQQRYVAARQFTRALGYDALPAAELLQRPAEEIVARVNAIQARGIKPGSDAAEAVLGLVVPPALKLSGLVSAFEATQRATLSSKSENQLQRWRTTKERAVNLLIEIVGDLRVDGLGRSHALDYRDHWQDRIDADEVEIDTANKAIGHLNKMWRELNRLRRLGLDPVFAELRLEGGGVGQRAAYEAPYVQSELMKPGAFGELNDEARRLIFLIADTGLRLSEAVNLRPDTIRLGHAVPHVAVEPDGRQMKTDDSRRTIPLVGAALAAMRKQPDGFPRYRDKASALSALANKLLHDKKLRPTPRHTIYSLRHCFEDRLTAVEAPEKLIAALMGHKYSRPKYGAGPSLEQKREWLQRIAFTAPDDV
ncbi:tyrosine-type recombinase/integrase [Bosea sp. LjRoot90]|uniref:tyrosine-type recombinase/integrase n=1 Tax=Bosea sp. LjRoot90 TaxID=3342342 RepID=UPI003ECEB9F2